MKRKRCLLLPPLLVALALGGILVWSTESVPPTVTVTDWLVEESDIAQGGLGQVVVKVENTGKAPICYPAHAPGDPLWTKAVRDERGNWSAQDGPFRTLAAGIHTLGPGESFSFTTEIAYLVGSEEVCPIGIYYAPVNATRNKGPISSWIEKLRSRFSWSEPDYDGFRVAFSTDPLMRDQSE